jgi:hypothetical protein
MNSLLGKGDLPLDNDDLIFADPPVTPNRENLLPGSGPGFWKKCSVSVIVLVAIIATSGWLYLIAKFIGTLVHWL